MEDPRVTDLRHLKIINRHSIGKDFNRTINWSKYFELMRHQCLERDVHFHGGILVPITPLIFHEHRSGRPCEKHIRTMVFAFGEAVFLDMTLQDFESLTPLKHVQKEAA